MLAVLGRSSGGDQHVLGLDVAVDEPARVRRVEGARDLGQQRDRATGVERALVADHRAQARALDETHREVALAVRLAGVVDGDDVRVVQGRSELRLEHEPLAEDLIFGELGAQKLERHDALQARMLGAVDHAHAAPAERLLDPVARNLEPGSEL